MPMVKLIILSSALAHLNINNLQVKETDISQLQCTPTDKHAETSSPNEHGIQVIYRMKLEQKTHCESKARLVSHQAALAPLRLGALSNYQSEAPYTSLFRDSNPDAIY